MTEEDSTRPMTKVLKNKTAVYRHAKKKAVILGYLNRGDLVPVNGKRKKRVEIDYKGQSGFVKSRYLRGASPTWNGQ